MARQLVDGGAEGTATQLNGYSIVGASDQAAAKALTDGHPFLSDHTGEFSVEIFELMPVPMWGRERGERCVPSPMLLPGPARAHARPGHWRRGGL
jgi:hypothetical protein